MRLATEADKGTKPPFLETTYHPYDLTADDPAWKELRGRLRRDGVSYMEASGGTTDSTPERVIRLETEYVFDNQWNAAADGHWPQGYRVFDWYLAYDRSGKAKRGHYLDVTDAMRDLRRLTYKCGYCGEQYYDPPPDAAFCGKCLGSEYLTAANLKLLRLRPVSEDLPRDELTPEESAFLRPLYLERQLAKRPETEAAQRDRIRLNHEKALRTANMERSGFEWLLDRGLDTHNVMFFGGLVSPPRFEFGWRGGYDEIVTEELKRRLKDFPYPYEVKRA